MKEMVKMQVCMVGLHLHKSCFLSCEFSVFFFPLLWNLELLCAVLMYMFQWECRSLLCFSTP